LASYHSQAKPSASARDISAGLRAAVERAPGRGAVRVGGDASAAASAAVTSYSSDQYCSRSCRLFSLSEARLPLRAPAGGALTAGTRVLGARVLGARVLGALTLGTLSLGALVLGTLAAASLTLATRAGGSRAFFRSASSALKVKISFFSA